MIARFFPTLADVHIIVDRRAVDVWEEALFAGGRSGVQQILAFIGKAPHAAGLFIKRRLAPIKVDGKEAAFFLRMELSACGEGQR